VGAVLLAAAAVAVRRACGAPPRDPWAEPGSVARQERWLTTARHLLGEAAFAQVWRQGLALAPDDAARVATRAGPQAASHILGATSAPNP
jgi:hypothetical protein